MNQRKGKLKPGRRQQSPRRPLQVAFPLFILLLFLPVTIIFAQHEEYQVKSLLIGQIARHVEWPDLGNQNEPFILGIFGENPFGTYMEETYLRDNKNKMIKGKKVIVRYIKRIEDIPGCHLLYISPILTIRAVSNIIEFTSGKPILTIGDNPEFIDEGIFVTMEISKTRRDITINETAARKAGLRFDESLLGSAKIINPYDPYEEKAQFLMPITDFVTWPPQSSVNRSSEPFKIAVLGQTPFKSKLEKFFKRKSLKDKPVKVLYISSIQEIDDAHLLFISMSMKDKIAEIIDYVKDKPVLTVGDTLDYHQQGVHINFVEEKYKVMFDVNEETAVKAGFKFSWNMLKQAKQVIRANQN